MAKLYYEKIKNGDINIMTGEVWNIDDVPTKWKNEVQKLLNDDINQI